LKEAVYGADRPPSALTAIRAGEEARRLAMTLPDLSTAFPGFRALSDELKRWLK
jgi:hypothetical protein